MTRWATSYSLEAEERDHKQDENGDAGDGECDVEGCALPARMIEAVAARVDGVVLEGDAGAFFERLVADDVGEVEVAFDRDS